LLSIQFRLSVLVRLPKRSYLNALLIESDISG